MSSMKSMQGSQPSAKPAHGPRLNRKPNGTSFWARLWAQRQLLLLLLPGLAFYAIFRYGPIYGLRVSFMNYSPFLGYDNSPWVGFGNFERLFVRNIDTFWLLLENTLTLSVLQFALTFPAGILFALILNEVRWPKLKKTYQTISYLPTFLSLVIVCAIFIDMFSYDGLVSDIIAFFGGNRENFMYTKSGYLLVYMVSALWAGLGNGAIIYLSALSGVDQEMYEAAEIDGCSRMKRIWHITIPSIMPTIGTMFLLSIGGLVRVGADKTLLLRNDITITDTYIFATYIYDLGIQKPELSYTAAIGLFESVVSAVLLVLFNYISRKTSESSLW